MGLDIYVIKPCPVKDADHWSWGDDSDYQATSNPKIVRTFPQYVVEREDMIRDFKAYGHPEWESQEYWDDPGHGYIETAENFYHIEGDDYVCISSDESVYEEYMKGLKPGVIVTKHLLKDIPERAIIVEEVPYQEIGYQRKGANQKFYEDGKWEDPEKVVVTQAELDHDIAEYFSSSSPGSKGGWGSFTEYTGLTDDERRKNFIDNIARHFKEGETAVVYW